MSERVVIVGVGASTAVGRGAWESAAAVRAGISGFTQHPAMLDTAGEPVHAAIAQWIHIDVRGTDRLEALLLPAIDEALSIEAPSHDPRRWALALALPAAKPGLAEGAGKELLSRLTRRCRDVLASAATFDGGHAGGLLALQAAHTKLARGELDACVVAAADSWIEPEALEHLEANDQLHGAGPLNNAWGFIPGEAGAALLLMRADVAHAAKLPVLATVLGVGTAHEPKRIKTKTVCIGEGLSLAFGGALASLPQGAKVSDIYCDLNGEPYRSDEFGFTALRTKQHFESVSDFVAPADCWGDVGAAGSLLHVVLACAATSKGYAKGLLAFAWASAESGERAAALLAGAA